MIDWGVLSEPVAIGLLVITALLLLGWLLTYHNQYRKIGSLQQDIEAQHELNDAHLRDITNHRVAHATLSEREQYSEKKIAELEVSLAAGESRIEALNRELSGCRSEITGLEIRLSEERKNSQEKLALLEDAKQKLGNEFKLLANQIFEERGKAFSEQNRSGIDEILKPMREQMGEFRKRVDEVHLNDSKDRASLKEHLAQLEKLNRQMSEDAVGLTQALKGESKSQGNWGEMILERILETSGLREGKEFAREQSFTGEDGRRLRPDVVVYMPGDKQVIIDSKVSLTDYERAISATDADNRKVALTAHLRSLKSHIQGLSSKNYEHLPNVHTPDYVLMFVPIEGAYLMAIEADASIFESAFEKRVAVVTPSTLYATLKLIEQLWRYERQSENVVKLIDRAGLLHDKVVDFVTAFEEIGQRLKQAKESYDTAHGRIKSGRGNVIKQIDELGKLAGKTQKELPKRLTDSAAISDQTDEDV
ncbi:MAG TPA: DNA recombination protein RmuC [Mariprofundaceae bacterium]|nr:DNA recombination protein RmuC [Mariprofundaceae bacterium]